MVGGGAASIGRLFANTAAEDMEPLKRSSTVDRSEYNYVSLIDPEEESRK